MVQGESALAGSLPVAAVLAGIQRNGAHVATHPQDQNAQSLFHHRGRTIRHAHSRIWNHAGTTGNYSRLPASFLLTTMSI